MSVKSWEGRNARPLTWTISPARTREVSPGSTPTEAWNKNPLLASSITWRAASVVLVGPDQDRAKAQGITVEEQKANASQQIPLGRYGDPVEFGRVGAFLLSPAASYVSGVALQADGALVTAIP